MDKSNTLKHAERELAILVGSAKDPENRPIIEPFIPEILALVDKFGHSGQSGGSAPYVASAISQAVKHLCMQETIAPLTGEDGEWNDVSGHGIPPEFQNNRLSSVFKDEKDGRAYYLDAIVFKSPNGHCWSCGDVKLKDGSSISSRQYIKSFPFYPKTFYVDILEIEWADKEEKVEKEGGGWWTHSVKDESQLEEVWKYYDRFFFKGEDEETKSPGDEPKISCCGASN
jgi:hypothetical protein